MKTKIIITLIIIVSAFAGVWYLLSDKRGDKKTIKIGVLHSLTGTMAISETSVVDATLLAIEEINKNGGLLGRKIEPIVADGRSDLSTFAKEAERLLKEEKVAVVFGCWTSASRKIVKKIFEKFNHLLFYPVQYEGLERSPNIVYTGAAPNQQIIPAIKWCFDNLGKNFFLVGSDYVFPRTANTIIKDQVTALRGEILGEEYILLGDKDFAGLVQKIVDTKPDVIINTVNGDSNIYFFKELRRAGITPKKIPTMSFSIAEEEIRTLSIENLVGDYASWNYFQSIDTDENKVFIEKFKKKYGTDRVTDDPIEAGYFGVHLWAQAVREAGTANVNEVRKTIRDQSINAPEGMVYINSKNLHTWKTVRIGKIREDGQFDIVWSSEKPVRPVPYPIYRSVSEWDKFLNDLYEGWGNKWENTKSF